MEILKRHGAQFSSIFQRGVEEVRKRGTLKLARGPFALVETMKPSAGWLAIGALMFCGGLARAEGDPVAGKTVFANRCASCHTTVPDVEGCDLLRP